MNIKDMKNLIKDAKVNGNVKKNAELYKDLYLLKDEIDTKMVELKQKLIESKVNEVFMDDNLKVVFEPGKQKSYLDTRLVYKIIGSLNVFLMVSTVSEKALKDNLKDADNIIARSKVILEERQSDTVAVMRITKEDKEAKLKKKIA